MDAGAQLHRRWRKDTGIGLLLAAAVVLGPPAVAGAQQDPREHDHAAGAPAAGAPDQKQEHRPGTPGAMMPDHAAAAARLKPLIEKMDAATGEAKIEAMAAVIAELTRERTNMHGHMDHMSRMMGEMQTMMERCPMKGQMMGGKTNGKTKP